MSRLAQQERQALADLLDRLGPDAPTLCEGWTSGDLAAHLVLRERRPDAALGIVVGPLAAYTASVQRALRQSRDWPSLVQSVRSGPPAPLRPLDEQINTVEFFVHHEDLRRASPGWTPRELAPELEAALWARLGPMAGLVARRSRVGVVLDAPGYGTREAHRGEPRVTVRGAPSELTLFAFGRRSVARVTLEGDAEAVTLLGADPLGI